MGGVQVQDESKKEGINLEADIIERDVQRQEVESKIFKANYNKRYKEI